MFFIKHLTTRKFLILISVAGYIPHNLATFESQSSIPLTNEYSSEVRCNKAGNRSLVDDSDNTTKLYNNETGELIQAYPEFFNPKFSPDGTRGSFCTKPRRPPIWTWRK